MKIEYISTKDQLEQLCQQFKSSPYLIIDTEFIRQTTYYPILALLQVYDGKTIGIVDPVAIKDLSPLFDVCFDPNITKVLHSARQDMEIFFHVCDKLPSPIFDTQIAAALLGYGSQIGYASLVKSLLNIDLDKSQTRTDWLKRPLTAKQLEYASNDVLYLEKIYHIQKQQLIEKNRLDWLQKDFKFLCEQSTYSIDSQEMWKKVRGNNRLQPKQLVSLQYLAAWREEQAAKHNVPRKRVMNDETLLNLATQLPKQVSHLKGCQSLNKKQLEEHGETLIKLIQNALQSPKENWPSHPPRYQLSKEQDAITDCLMAINHLSAAQNNISPSCLCNRKELEQLVIGKRDLNILSGWRFELAGRDLLNFIDGKSSLSMPQGELELATSD